METSPKVVPPVASSFKVKAKPAAAVKEVRDGYRTRRRNQIETTTFDAANKYVKKKKEPPKKRILTSSDSSDVTSDALSEEEVQFIQEGKSWGRLLKKPVLEPPVVKLRSKSDDSSIDKLLTSTTSEDNFDFLDDLMKECKAAPRAEPVQEKVEDLLDKITAADEGPIGVTGLGAPYPDFMMVC